MKAAGGTAARALHGAVIVMAAPMAAAGLSLGCFLRNFSRSPELFFGGSIDGHRLPGTGLADFGMTLFLALLTVVWAAALAHFLLSNRRSPIALGLALLSLVAFAGFGWNTWIYAYPVCNPF
jgi:hypothetical protein